MTTQTVSVSTPRGTMPVWVIAADAAHDAPLIVLYMDAPGIRPALHDHAARLVAAGYRVAMPDLYYEIPADDRPRLDLLQAGDAEEFGRMGAVVGRLNDGDILDDTQLMVGALCQESASWGCVGFCLGGRLALRATERFHGRLPAASLLHPSGLVTDRPDSPHLAVGEVTAKLYMGFGEKDHVTPLSMIPPLRTELERHGVSFEIEVLEGADHGFTMPDLPAYNSTATELAWAGTLAVLGDRLPTHG